MHIYIFIIQYFRSECSNTFAYMCIFKERNHKEENRWKSISIKSRGTRTRGTWHTAYENHDETVWLRKPVEHYICEVCLHRNGCSFIYIYIYTDAIEREHMVSPRRPRTVYRVPSSACSETVQQMVQEPHGSCSASPSSTSSSFLLSLFFSFPPSNSPSSSIFSRRVAFWFLFFFSFSLFFSFLHRVFSFLPLPFRELLILATYTVHFLDFFISPLISVCFCSSFLLFSSYFASCRYVFFLSFSLFLALILRRFLFFFFSVKLYFHSCSSFHLFFSFLGKIISLFFSSYIFFTEWYKSNSLFSLKKFHE